MKLYQSTNLKTSIRKLLLEKFPEGNVYVYTGKYYSYSISKQIFDSRDRVMFLGELKTPLNKYILENNIREDDVVVGVGGGKVMDVAKEIAYRTKANSVLIPVVLSNESAWTGLVVLDEVNNGKSIYRKSADYVFVDIKTLSDSPKKYIQSSLGELFSNFSAINDWNLANDNNIVQELVDNSLRIFELESFFNPNSIIESLIFSAKAINYCNNSWPVSGSEHLIYHSLNKMSLINNYTHGFVVAAISPFTLFIHGKLTSKHIYYLSVLRIPLLFSSLNESIEENLYEIFDLSKKYRNDRYTILNEKMPQQLVLDYLDYKEFVSDLVENNNYVGWE